jgi:DNA-binding response OmpR family regulator
MTGTKMAPIKIVSGNEELGRIDAKHIMRVLLVEDEKDLRQGIVQRLSDSGYSIDAFASPREAAENMNSNEYQLAIMDIRFDAPSVSGDEFIHKNADFFNNTRVVAFTGHENDIVHDVDFDEVFLKGRSRDPLYEYAEAVYRDRQKEVAGEIQDKLTRKQDSIAKLAGAKEELLRVLNETKNKETKLVWYKGKELSTFELIQEVEDPTSAVGRAHIRMMADWLSRKDS